MRFHAEQLKSVGAGLLSESNHGLKSAIEETNAILENIAKGLYERDSNAIDPASFIEDKLLPQVVQFMAVKIKKQFPEINDNQVGDLIVNGLKRVSQHLGVIKQTSRIAAKKSDAMGRQIKRGF